MKIIQVLIFFLTLHTYHAQEVYTKEIALMGSKFQITVVAHSPTEADNHIQNAIDEIQRIENLISEWNPNSAVSNINLNAGIKPIEVPSELLNLTQRAINFSNLTNGAFDISFASINHIWKFDGSMTQLPTQCQIENSIANIDYNNIVIDADKSTIYLKKKGMKIGFGSIGKGYAADKARQLLQDKGVSGGIINASGDISVWGTQPSGSAWIIGITNPMNPNNLFATFPMTNGAVATSGTYEKFVVINGQKYSHIINPKTGMPAKGVMSATVFAPSAELANGFSTSIIVMGAISGVALINRYKALSCLVIDDDGGIHTSTNISLQE